MIEAAIQLIQEQLGAINAAYLAFYHPSSLSTSSSLSSFSIRLFHAWNALMKKQKRTVRSAYIQFVALYILIGSLIWAEVMYSIEDQGGKKRSFVDCLFTMGSAASGTGLTVIDTFALHTSTNILIGFVILFF